MVSFEQIAKVLKTPVSRRSALAMGAVAVEEATIGAGMRTVDSVVSWLMGNGTNSNGNVAEAAELHQDFQKDYTIVMDAKSQYMIWGVIEQTLFGRLIDAPKERDALRKKLFIIERRKGFDQGYYLVANSGKGTKENPIATHLDYRAVTKKQLDEILAKDKQRLRGQIDAQNFDWLFIGDESKGMADKVRINMKAVYEFMQGKWGKNSYVSQADFIARLKAGDKAYGKDSDRNIVVVGYDDTLETRYKGRIDKILLEKKVSLTSSDEKVKRREALARIVSPATVTGVIKEAAVKPRYVPEAKKADQALAQMDEYLKKTDFERWLKEVYQKDIGALEKQMNPWRNAVGQGQYKK